MKLHELTPDQRRAVHEGTGISIDVLRHMQKKRRSVSALVAQKIEHAATLLGLRLRREDMCEACRRCDLAKKARSVK